MYVFVALGVLCACTFVTADAPYGYGPGPSYKSGGYHSHYTTSPPPPPPYGGSYGGGGGYHQPPEPYHPMKHDGYSPSPKYKREAAADYYGGKSGDYPKKDDYKKDSSYSSTGGSYGGGGKSYNIYYEPTKFIEYVVDLKGKEGGTYEPAKPWKADCNGYSYGYKYAWITAIWDDYDFKTLKYTKCAGPKSDEYDDKYGGGYKLDLYDAKLIDFSSGDSGYGAKPDSYGKPDGYGAKPDGYGKSDYKPPVCYKGYILTALWANDYDWKTLKYGKCVRLETGLVDYSTCDNFYTSYKDGGTYEAYKKWNVECPYEWAAVGLKRDYDRVEYLRCCKLIQPHPPAKYYDSYQ